MIQVMKERSKILRVVALLAMAIPVSSQSSGPRPLTLPLQCPKAECPGECPLLEGVPQTTGSEAGSSG